MVSRHVDVWNSGCTWLTLPQTSFCSRSKRERWYEPRLHAETTTWSHGDTVVQGVTKVRTLPFICRVHTAIATRLNPDAVHLAKHCPDAINNMNLQVFLASADVGDGYRLGSAWDRLP